MISTAVRERLKSLREPALWLVAIGAAIATGVGTRAYLASGEALARDALERRYRPTPIVVARTDLVPGVALAPEVLAIRNMPADFLPAGSVRPAQAGEFLGRTVAHAVRAGEPIQTSLLRARNEASLAQRIALGRRAVTVAVDEAAAAAGLLRPGDRVDLRWRGGAKDALLNVAVLATGRHMQDDATGHPQEYSTVTLELAEADARRLAERDVGDLRLMLRNPSDTGDALLARIVGAPRPPPVRVTLIAGGGGGPIPAMRQLVEGAP